jgi:sigma-E factor negative regulatory protein RseA
MQPIQVREHAEALSALMDDESTELDLRRLLKDFPESQEMAQTWSRYNLARSILHKEEVAGISAPGTQRILAAIAAEPVHGSGPVVQSREVSAWMPMAGRLAVAACVSLAVFLGLQSALEQGSPSSMMAGAGTQQPPVSVAPAASQVEVAEDGSFDAEAQQRLDDYIRGVSIQYREAGASRSAFNILQDSQLIRQVNQIEN